jgi:hypothetical protein
VHAPDPRLYAGNEGRPADRLLPLQLENLSLAGARIDIGVRPEGVSVNGLPPGARLVGADGRDQSTVIS